MLEEHIEASWKTALAGEFNQPYFANIKSALLEANEQGLTVYPQGGLIFNAFNQTPLPQVKVVILGQDPYHQPGQAMGLSFSVPKDVRIPASLRNVYKELATSVPDFVVPQHGDLSAWAEQGVLLLNCALTVLRGQPASHAKIGWQTFTDAVIRTLSREREGVVFLLWGNFAQKKSVLIDATRHHVLTAVHPSPLARGGFMGCGHFVRTNEILVSQGLSPIDWQV